MSSFLDALHLAFDHLLVGFLAWICAWLLARAAAARCFPHAVAQRSARVLLMASLVAPFLIRFMPLEAWFLPQVEIWRETAGLNAFAGSLSVSVSTPAPAVAAPGAAFLFWEHKLLLFLLAPAFLCGAWGIRRHPQSRRRLGALLASFPPFLLSGVAVGWSCARVPMQWEHFPASWEYGRSR